MGRWYLSIFDTNRLHIRRKHKHKHKQLSCVWTRTTQPQEKGALKCPPSSHTLCLCFCLHRMCKPAFTIHNSLNDLLYVGLIWGGMLKHQKSVLGWGNGKKLFFRMSKPNSQSINPSFFFISLLDWALKFLDCLVLLQPRHHTCPLYWNSEEQQNAKLL